MIWRGEIKAMDKDERIARYGEEAYEKKLEQQRAWQEEHKEEVKVANKEYREEHPEQVKTYNKRYYEENQEREKARSHEQSRKGGKYYGNALEYLRTGIPGERCRIRSKHAKKYRPYKAIIAPESQIHH